MTGSVFISGAAQGIGRASAELLAERGWTVGAYDIADDFSWATSPNIHTGHLDVTDPQSWEDALADFAEKAGGVDVLVNNAGVLYGGPFTSSGSYEDDARLVDVNVKGPLYGARAVHPYLLRSDNPKLVNLASASSIYGTPDMATYSATKFAVRGITEALDQEWEEQGILVRSVWPLYVNTGMLDGVETTGTKRMGVRLGPKGVAKVEAKRSTPAQVHYGVGLQTKAMMLLSRFSPAWMTRLLNAKLTTDRKVRP